MIEPRFDEDQLPTEEEVTQETERILSRDVIAYHRVGDAAYGVKWMLYPVNSPQRAEVAEQIARYFHKETGFDFPPYMVGDEGEDNPVYLVRSKASTTCVPIIAGAVGFQKVRSDWVLTWIWLHPWERGGRLVDAVFKTLDEVHGDFYIEAPVSNAMRGLMRKRQYDDSRVVRIERH